MPGEVVNGAFLKMLVPHRLVVSAPIIGHILIAKQPEKFRQMLFCIHWVFKSFYKRTYIFQGAVFVLEKERFKEYFIQFVNCQAIATQKCCGYLSAV